LYASARIREHLNVLLMGPTGVGKSFIACALAHATCRADFSVRCYRLPRLIEELAHYGAMQKRSALYRQLAKADLIVIDDFGIAPLADESVRDLLAILDDRYDRRSTLITSQLPLDQWHAYLGDRTVADAILDRLVHNSYRLVLKGDSMRKHPRLGAQERRPLTTEGELTKQRFSPIVSITASHPGPACPGTPGPDIGWNAGPA
jgi:DNA replication protein DnaC